jgi:hypothetical protein
MQKIILFIILLFFGLTSFSQPFDCSRFKEGKFRTADPRVGGIVETERRGGFQTESTESLKLILRFSISWQDNCSYTLRLDKIMRNENKVEIPNNLQVNVKIIETKPGSYIQEISSSMTNGTYRAEAVKE